jgi:hypothetical protein
MPVQLETAAIDGSTYAITVSFFNEDGDPMSPHDPITWTLTDQAGNVVNNRQGVSAAIANGQTAVTIVLHGNDLAVEYDTIYLMLVEGTYDSDLGNNLEIRDQVEFVVKHLVEPITGD